MTTFIILSALRGISKFSGLFSYWFKTVCVHKWSPGLESLTRHLELWNFPGLLTQIYWKWSIQQTDSERDSTWPLENAVVSIYLLTVEERRNPGRQGTLPSAKTPKGSPAAPAQVPEGVLPEISSQPRSGRSTGSYVCRPCTHSRTGTPSWCRWCSAPPSLQWKRIFGWRHHLNPGHLWFPLHSDAPTYATGSSAQWEKEARKKAKSTVSVFLGFSTLDPRPISYCQEVWHGEHSGPNLFITLGIVNSNAYRGWTGNINEWIRLGYTTGNGGECGKLGSAWATLCFSQFCHAGMWVHCEQLFQLLGSEGVRRN